MHDPDWNTRSLEVMERILRAKLSQHKDVLDALKRSGTDDIVENSPTDYFWGAGQDGTGQNHLGKLWMKIRSEL
jgi:N-glycosidase YbiA